MELKSINKSYYLNKKELKILTNVNLAIESGKFYAIMGRSGSGKTTLINIIGLLDDYSSGKYYIDNMEVKNLDDCQKSNLRALKIGFVFQSFYLNDNLTSLENVMLPMLINPKIKKEERQKLALDLIEKVGLKARINHYPKELSAGECQRIAIARALANNPEVIIADEPTGNLDRKSEEIVLKLLKSIVLDGKTVIMVSHNEIVKSYCDVLYLLEEGNLRKGKK